MRKVGFVNACAFRRSEAMEYDIARGICVVPTAANEGNGLLNGKQEIPICCSVNSPGDSSMVWVYAQGSVHKSKENFSVQSYRSGLAGVCISST